MKKTVVLIFLGFCLSIPPAFSFNTESIVSKKASPGTLQVDVLPPKLLKIRQDFEMLRFNLLVQMGTFFRDYDKLDETDKRTFGGLVDVDSLSNLIDYSAGAMAADTECVIESLKGKRLNEKEIEDILNGIQTKP